jgi:hypothetical protein
MTAQHHERLILNGETLKLAATPLEDYFSQSNTPTPFRMVHTGLHRGYVGTWEIKGDRLYLTDLMVPAYGKDPDTKKPFLIERKVDISTIFSDATDIVFADWFTGELRCPQGELKEYHHGGFASIYEADLLITVVSGCVTDTTTRKNTHGRPYEDATSFADAVCTACSYRKRLHIPATYWNERGVPIAAVWCSPCKDVTLANHDAPELRCLDCGSKDLRQPYQMRGTWWGNEWRSFLHTLEHGALVSRWQFGGNEVSFGKAEYQCPSCRRYKLKFESAMVVDRW